MVNLSHLSNGHRQRFYEDLYVYCSEQDSYQIAERLQKELKVFLPEIEELLAFSIQECEEDEYGLAEELEPGCEQTNLRPYMITQHFFLNVLDLSDQSIDPVSDSVFEAVKEAVINTPYFSFMGLVEDEDEAEQ